MPNRLVVGPYHFFPDIQDCYHVAVASDSSLGGAFQAAILQQARLFQKYAGVTHITTINVPLLCPDQFIDLGLEVESVIRDTVPLQEITRISCSDYRLNSVLFGTRERNHLRSAGGLRGIVQEDQFVLSQIQTMRQMGVKEFEGGNHGGVCAGYAGDNPHYPTDPTREEEFHREQGEAAARVLWKHFGVRLALGYYRPNERGFEFIPLA